MNGPKRIAEGLGMYKDSGKLLGDVETEINNGYDGGQGLRLGQNEFL